MKEGWAKSIFTDVCKVINGRAYSKDEMLAEGKYRLLRVGNFFTNDSWYYSDLELEEDKYFEDGDLLYAWSASFGPRIWHGEKTIYHYHIWKLICTNKIDKHYLCYWLESETFKKQVMKSLHGATMMHVTKAIMEHTQVNYPIEISEQQQIVDFLDTEFAKIDELKNQAEQSLQNAKDLFQAALKEMLTPKEGWKMVTLPEISDNLDSKRIPVTKGKRDEGKYPYYGASGIVDYVGDYIFDEDLLLISEDGANLLARTYPIAFSVSGKIWVNNHAHVLKFSDLTTQRFVEYYFASIDISDYVTGAAQPKFAQKKMNILPIPYPSIEEQKVVVETLELIEKKIQQLQSNYTRTIQLCADLKQALLRQVFE